MNLHWNCSTLYMCSSCHIRHLKKRWNSCRTWNICYVFNFQLKKIRSKIIQITLIELWSFISFELRHLNSIKMSQKAKFGFSIFQLKIKWKQIFQVQHQFGHFVKCRIWHEKHINLLLITVKIDPKLIPENKVLFLYFLRRTFQFSGFWSKTKVKELV